MHTLSSHLINLGVSFLLLTALFVPLERTFTARTQPHFRKECWLDLGYFVAQYLVFVPLLLRFNNGLQECVSSIGPQRFFPWVGHLPRICQAVVVVMLGDLLVYWGHRWSHTVPWLWRFHAVHHSVRELDWLAAHREHPLDGLYSQLCVNTPAFVLGVDVEALMPVFVVRGLWATFVHSNVRMPLGPVGVFFGDPVLHRWHHAARAETVQNFANLAPYLDMVFRTHYRPEAEEYPLGLAGTYPSHLIGQLLLPCVRLPHTSAPASRHPLLPHRHPDLCPQALDGKAGTCHQPDGERDATGEGSREDAVGGAGGAGLGAARMAGEACGSGRQETTSRSRAHAQC